MGISTRGNSQIIHKHKSFTVKKVGLVLHPQHRYIGASPDGLCTCRCCPNMVLEIKCPYSIKEANKTLNDGWNLTDFLQKDGENILLKRSHKYYMFSSSTTWDRSTTHPKFDPTGVRTHDFQIMTVHFMSLRRPSSSPACKYIV